MASAPKQGGPNCRGCRRFLYADEGFSTVGMIFALLLTLSLIFTAGRVYQLESASAHIQSVADVAALAAENEVAEFYIVVRLCDAVVLTMTLTGVSAMGLGVAALCTPATASLGSNLIKLSSDIIDARNSFAETAAAGLNKLQAALPFLCAAQAASIAHENSGDVHGANYFGFAVALPGKGEPIEVGISAAADDLLGNVQDNEDALREAAEKAEEAAREAKVEKERAFMADCGNNPAYCMYERADHLAGLSAGENPLYRTVDSWSFSVALKRAQSYYAARLASEAPEGTSIDEQARSALRTRFYHYAVSELARGYVHESEDAFDALFPLLPKNTAEMRQTDLYTEVAYPMTTDEAGMAMLHAWAGCPGASAAHAAGFGSISQMEAGAFSRCTVCEFSAASLGKVAAASTSIENGFEYHYHIVAEAAQAYQKARETGRPYVEEAKQIAEGLMGAIGETLRDAGSYRIKAVPPGHFGAVAFVADTSRLPIADLFPSAFVQGDSSLGTRVAISAATLASDDPDEGKTVITSLLDSIGSESGGEALGPLGIVLQLWSSLLSFYSQGADSLVQGIDDALSSMPLASESGLGVWASRALSQVIASLGLEPASLDSLKPVLVNTAHVLAADSGRFGAALLSAKEKGVSLGDAAGADVFSTALSVLESSALDAIADLEGGIELAIIQPFGSAGPSVPLVITLPPSAVSAAGQAVHDSVARMKEVYGQMGGMVRWE